MRLLLDACLARQARDVVRDSGHDVVWAGDWPQDPGDEEILRIAHHEGRILVTLDKDFGELVVHQAKPHSGIVRLIGFRSSDQGPAVLGILAAHEAALAAGALLTAEPGRIRLRLRPR